MNKFVNNIGYLFFFSFWKLFAFLPLRVLYGLSDMLYYIVYYIVRYRKSVVFENLRSAFPNKDIKELNVIAKRFYRHFCDLFAETFKLLSISEKEAKRRFKVVNSEDIVDEYNRGKHVLCVLSHFNNWEPFNIIGLYIPHYFVSIYKPLSNQYFDRLMIRLRSQYNHHVIPMSQTARVLTQNIQEGKLTFLCFLSDQSPQSHEVQYWANFLNQKTAVYLGVEKLAIKTRQPVYYLDITKVKRGYYDGKFIKLCDDASLLKPFELTDLHIKTLEGKILENPQYWLWTHRRWKLKPRKL